MELPWDMGGPRREPEEATSTSDFSPHGWQDWVYECGMKPEAWRMCPLSLVPEPGLGGGFQSCCVTRQCQPL